MRIKPLSKTTIKLLLLLLLYKFLCLSFTYFWAVHYPSSFNFSNYYGNFHWPPNHNLGWLDFFSTWDAQPYLYVSQMGYAVWSSSAISQFAFFPLWPAAISLATHVIPDPVLCSLILSNVFSLLAWLFFYRLVDEMYGPAIAGWSLIFLVFYPGAIFFQFPYSESLFFLLTILFFYGLCGKNRKDPKSRLLAICAGILLPLTRAVGVLLLLPALVSERRAENKLRKYSPAIAIVFGFLLYLTFMMVVAGDCMAGFTAQNGFLGQASALRMLDPFACWKAFCTVTGVHNFQGSLLDRLMFVLLLITLYPTYKLNKMFFCYSLLLGVLPAVSTYFMSFTRYSAIVFPMFLVAGTFFSKPGREYWGGFLAAALLFLQLFLLLQHITFYWSG